MPPEDRMEQKINELIEKGCTREEAIAQLEVKNKNENKEANTLLDAQHNAELNDFLNGQS